MEVFYIPELALFMVYIGELVVTAPTVVELSAWLASAKTC